MRRLPAVPGWAYAPQAPGRTPHRPALRLPGGETLLVPGASPRTPVPPEASEAPAREEMMLSPEPAADLLVTGARLGATCDSGRRELARGWVAIPGRLATPLRAA